MSNKKITIRYRQRRHRYCNLLALWVVLVCSSIFGQSGHPSTRITQPVDEERLTILKGNTHPLARPIFDLGVASADVPMERMLLVLKRSDEQEAALRQLLDDLQTRASSNYHRWLTPDEFGGQYGPSDSDLQTVTSWLQYHGFHVANHSRGRTVIEFSGTAGQIKDTFRTEIHRYLVNGQEYWANSSDPEIPSAFDSVIAGIDSLHNFGRKAQHHIARFQTEDAETKAGFGITATNVSTAGTNSSCGLFGAPCRLLSPDLFATIYNVQPLWTATPPIDGTGQTIAIVGQSDIYPQDFANFRKDFGLPSGTLNIIYDGPPPNKQPFSGDELESDLDVEWSGAVAKGATIDLVASTTTNSTAGVDLSALYIVENNLAPVMSESYGACELFMGTAANQFYNQLWQQAAAQGITVFVSTGDSGAAGCDRNDPYATYGLAVNGISSSPYNVAVGGTDFDGSSNSSRYRNSRRDQTVIPPSQGYVPEITWNDTCTSSEFFTLTGKTDAESDCNDYNSQYWPAFVPPVGGSGGASNCITSDGQSVSSCSGGYLKPTWQAGPGVPNDGARDVPDVSLFAGDGINGAAYLVCETDIYSGCAGGTNTMVHLGGTSASAPTFAGIMAMVVQLTQSRQGNANFVLYPFAAQAGASCDSTGTTSDACVFYDITTGTIAMACQAGSPDCVINTVGDQFGVLSGYATTTGFDRATGLGSVNAANLVNNWSSVSFQSTISTLGLSPTQITHGSTVNVDVSVVPNGGTGIPTGQVSLLTSTGLPGGTFTLVDGSIASSTTQLPGGSYTVSAHYAGDGTYAASDSTPGISVTVNPEPSTTTVQAYTIAKNGDFIPFTSGPYGQQTVYLQANVAGQSGQGVPTGTVNLTQNLNGTITNLPGDPFSLNSEGYAFLLPLSQTPFTGGTYNIAGTYSGDNSFKPNSTQGVNFTITPAQTQLSTNLTNCILENPCVLGAGSQIQILAAVNYTAPAFGSLQPTGTATLYSNGKVVASTPIDSYVIPPGAGFMTQLPLGLDTITIQYSGDSNYAGSTSSAAIIDVGGTYSVAANPSTIIVTNPGQSGSTTLMFSAQNGLTGSGTLSTSMCSGLPPNSTCGFTPSTVTFTSSTTAVPVTFTIITTGPASARSSSRRLAWTNWRRSIGVAAFVSFGVCLMPLGVLRRHGRRLMAFLALLTVAALVSCGGGGANGGGGGGGSGGTPTGNYGVVLNLSVAGIAQTANVNVDVQ